MSSIVPLANHRSANRARLPSALAPVLCVMDELRQGSVVLWIRWWRTVGFARFGVLGQPLVAGRHIYHYAPAIGVRHLGSPRHGFHREEP
jgi:hypothetical protein